MSELIVGKTGFNPCYKTCRALLKILEGDEVKQKHNKFGFALDLLKLRKNHQGGDGYSDLVKNYVHHSNGVATSEDMETFLGRNYEPCTVDEGFIVALRHRKGKELDNIGLYTQNKEPRKRRPLLFKPDQGTGPVFTTLAEFIRKNGNRKTTTFYRPRTA